MTKDDKEFFDKAMLAALTGLVARGCWSAADASDMAQGALARRNVVLQELGYQELPQAEPLPSFFSAPPIPLISGDLTPSASLKEHLHGRFDKATVEPEKSDSHSGETSTGLLIRDILGVARTNKGRRVTATEVYMLLPHPFEPQEGPTINELRDIGRVLRENGYTIRRIGGKDLYQL